MKTLLAAAVLCLLAFPVLAKTPPPPEEGAKAPAFTLNSQEGKPVSLADYRGKWVVLYFYPKDFTGGCTIEAHGFQKSLPKFEEKGAVVLGVSGQSADSHKEFCAKEGLNFKLLADEKMSASKAYGSVIKLGVADLSARNTFVISPGGFVAKRFLKVDPAGHAAEVLAALADLQAKK
jgi:peroxiredoxin Q/BCP